MASRTVIITHTGSSTNNTLGYAVYYEFSANNWVYASVGGNVPKGQSVTNTVTASSATGYRINWSQATPAAGPWDTASQWVANGGTLNFTIGWAPAAPPTYYQFWTANYTNDTASDQTVFLGWEGSSTNGAGVTDVSWVLHPGQGLSGINFTNLGTGATGYVTDSNGNHLANLGSGTTGSSSGTVTGGTGGGSTPQNPFVGTVGAGLAGTGGSTNGATGRDINLLGAALGQGNSQIIAGLDAIRSAITNGTGTNTVYDKGPDDSTNNHGAQTYSVGGNQTNAAAAWSAGDDAFGHGTNFTTSAGYASMTGAGVIGEGEGSAAGLSFAFAGGTTINLDPEERFPGVMGWIKKLWTFLLLVGFSLTTAKLFRSAAQSFASAQTGGVPDLNVLLAGFGGNVIGFGVAIIVAFAIIGIWVIAFNYLFAAALDSLGLLPNATANFTMNGNQIALYLLNASFPVALFFSLLSARIGLEWTAAKIIGLAAAASRFLIHK